MASMEEKERKFDDEYWFSFRILSHSPLVTFSTMDHQNAYIDKLASAVPRAFSAKNAIHFIKTTWNFETHGVLRLVEAIKKQQRSLPDHRFIILANYDYEAFLMAGAGLEVIVANDGLFSDETLWTISQNGLEGFGQYDAVYNGRFSRVKRHELAVAVKSLLLIYGHAIDEGDDTAFERVSALLPNAVFANHQIGTGHYTNLEHRLVALLYRHASIGLCLSAQEGAMRVSLRNTCFAVCLLSQRTASVAATAIIASRLQRWWLTILTSLPMPSQNWFRPILTENA